MVAKLAIGLVLFLIAIIVLAIGLTFFGDYSAGPTIAIFALAIVMAIAGLYLLFKSNSANTQILATKYTITISAEDGREIYSFTGKINPTVYSNLNMIKFVDESGNKQIIKWGATDTLIVSENDEKSS